MASQSFYNYIYTLRPTSSKDSGSSVKPLVPKAAKMDYKAAKASLDKSRDEVLRPRSTLSTPPTSKLDSMMLWGPCCFKATVRAIHGAIARIYFCGSLTSWNDYSDVGVSPFPGSMFRQCNGAKSTVIVD